MLRLLAAVLLRAVVFFAAGLRVELADLRVLLPLRLELLFGLLTGISMDCSKQVYRVLQPCGWILDNPNENNARLR